MRVIFPGFGALLVCHISDLVLDDFLLFLTPTHISYSVVNLKILKDLIGLLSKFIILPFSIKFNCHFVKLVPNKKKIFNENSLQVDATF